MMLLQHSVNLQRPIELYFKWVNFKVYESYLKTVFIKSPSIKGHKDNKIHISL